MLLTYISDWCFSRKKNFVVFQHHNLLFINTDGAFLVHLPKCICELSDSLFHNVFVFVLNLFIFFSLILHM